MLNFKNLSDPHGEKLLLAKNLHIFLFKKIYSKNSFQKGKKNLPTLLSAFPFFQQSANGL